MRLAGRREQRFNPLYKARSETHSCVVRVLSLHAKPIHRIRYINAAPRGRGRESAVLPLLTGVVDALPCGIEALVVTSDLQGVVPVHGEPNRLLGEALVDELLRLIEHRVLPEQQSIGVVLAGDLYSAPGGDKRGASGDVRDVWRAFAETFRWVVGVAGNHDRFGSLQDMRRLQQTPDLHLLDGDTRRLDGLSVGGVGNIIGRSDKPGRVSEGDFVAALDLVLDTEPELLVLHQGPNGHRGQRGCEIVRQRLIDAVPREAGPALVVCGHVHWLEPLATIDDAQVLNVDARAVVLRAA